MSEGKITLPAQAPVMVLAETLLFPHALMPLHIFEQRYRAMLNWALVHERMFCIALPKPGVTEPKRDSDIFHTAGIGMVRACVTGKDGTSNLMLQGVGRVRFTGFAQVAPFRIAKLEPLPSVPPAGKVTKLIKQLRAECERLPSGMMPQPVAEFIAKMEDGDMLADTIAHSFIRNPLSRQAVMDEPRVRERLELVLSFLHAQEDEGAA